MSTSRNPLLQCLGRSLFWYIRDNYGYEMIGSTYWCARSTPKNINLRLFLFVYLVFFLNGFYHDNTIKSTMFHHHLVIFSIFFNHYLSKSKVGRFSASKVVIARFLKQSMIWIYLGNRRASICSVKMNINNLILRKVNEGKQIGWHRLVNKVDIGGFVHRTFIVFIIWL